MTIADQKQATPDEEAFHRTLGSMLRSRRLELGYSLESVAEALRLSGVQVGRYETGENPMTAGRFRRVAGALDLHPTGTLAAAEAAHRAEDGEPADMHKDLMFIIDCFLEIEDRAGQIALRDAVRRFVTDGTTLKSP